MNLEDSMKLESESGSIKVLYHAKEVNIVTANQADLEIFLDGAPVDETYAGSDLNSGNAITVAEPDLYNIISSKEPATHELEVKIKGQGFEIYTFTFG
jgi:hypothetical protein